MDDKTTTTVVEDTAAEQKVADNKVDYETEMKKLREENEKLKKAQTNAAKDASDWKAKFRATQDEATRAAEEQKETLAKVIAENEALRNAQKMATHKAGWLGLGFDETLASEAADASVNSDFDALLAAMKKFIENHDKELNAANIRNMPAPVSGSPAQSVTKEQFDKMGYDEMVEVFTKYPDLYKEFTKK